MFAGLPAALPSLRLALLIMISTVMQQSPHHCSCSVCLPHSGVSALLFLLGLGLPNMSATCAAILFIAIWTGNTFLASAACTCRPSHRRHNRANRISIQHTRPRRSSKVAAENLVNTCSCRCNGARDRAPRAHGILAKHYCLKIVQPLRNVVIGNAPPLKHIRMLHGQLLVCQV